MILERHISTEGHVVHLTLEGAKYGWNIRRELDAEIVYIEHHDDWHRTERAWHRLEREVAHHGIDAALNGKST